jgi:hypothetical protein
MAQQIQTVARTERMPRVLRTGLLAGLGALLAGAAYLLAVRGEALILDLGAISQRIFCF